MQLRQYANVILKWWWLILASVILSTTSSYLYTHTMLRAYQTRTTIVVEPAPVPVQPVAPRVTHILMLAAAIGLALSCGAVFLYEYIKGHSRNGHKPSVRRSRVLLSGRDGHSSEPTYPPTEPTNQPTEPTPLAAAPVQADSSMPVEPRPAEPEPAAGREAAPLSMEELLPPWPAAAPVWTNSSMPVEPRPAELEPDARREATRLSMNELLPPWPAAAPVWTDSSAPVEPGPAEPEPAAPAQTDSPTLIEPRPTELEPASTPGADQADRASACDEPASPASPVAKPRRAAARRANKKRTAALQDAIRVSLQDLGSQLPPPEAASDNMVPGKRGLAGSDV